MFGDSKKKSKPMDMLLALPTSDEEGDEGHDPLADDEDEGGVPVAFDLAYTEYKSKPSAQALWDLLESFHKSEK